MKDGGTVDIDLIEENPSYEERRSQWTEDMHSFLKDSFVFVPLNVISSLE